MSSMLGMVTVDACLFSENTAVMNGIGRGAGLYVYDTWLLVRNSSFISNQVLCTAASGLSDTSDGRGGGLWHLGYSLQLLDVLFASNWLGRASSTAGFLGVVYGGGKLILYRRSRHGSEGKHE